MMPVYDLLFLFDDLGFTVDIQVTQTQLSLSFEPPELASISCGFSQSLQHSDWKRGCD